MKYRTGDFKQILGISAETIRFFEKQGIINPSRDISNNYRYFHATDLNKIVAYKFYRGLNFSMKETIDILNENSLPEYIPIISDKIIATEKQIIHSTRLLKRLIELRKSLESAKNILNQIHVEDSPGFYFYHNQTNDEFKLTNQIRTETAKWIEKIPFVNLALYIPPEVSIESKLVHLGYVLKEEDKQILKESDLTYTWYKDSCESLHTVIKCSINDDFCMKRLSHVFEYMQSNGMRQNGGITGWILFEENMSNEMNRFFEVWIPFSRL